VARYLGQRMQKSKNVTTSNWANPRLNERQMLYAANDAQVALARLSRWRWRPPGDLKAA
jgi:ribonuclease D